MSPRSEGGLSSPDEVSLLGVECRVRLGVPDAERRRPQRVLIDVRMEVDCRKAAAGDDFRRAVDYWAVEKAVRAEAERGERRLLEALAEDLARVVLKLDRRVKAVTLAVHKTPAVMPRTREVVVRLTRRR